MNTIRDLAILSSHVYSTVHRHWHGERFYQGYSCDEVLPELLESSFWLLPVDVSATISETDHFFAQLYLKVDSGQITDAVVAIRGTIFDDKDNVWVDVKAWYAAALGDASDDGLPDYMMAAVSYYTNAVAYVRQHFSHLVEVELTGHSLGGALAKLVAANYLMNVSTTVFNAPGVAHIVHAADQQGSDVLNVNSRYGVINKIDSPEPYAKTILVDVPNAEPIAKVISQRFSTKEYHVAKWLHQQGAHGVGGFVELTNISRTTFVSYASLSYEEISSCVLKAAPTSIRDTYALYAAYHYQASSMYCLVAGAANGGKDLVGAIAKQHSIENMIDAFHLDQNADIGLTYRATVTAEHQAHRAVV